MFDNCIEIIFEMQHRFREWWEKIKNRDFEIDDYVHKLIDVMWIKTNEQHFEIKWIDVVCKKKNIRITLSNISHESHESCIAIRRIMFSWFFQITKNHETLENVETNIWFELIIIHRNLILFVQTSFDFAHHFDAMSYRFSVAMKLTDLNSLSNALICRKK